MLCASVRTRVWIPAAVLKARHSLLQAYDSITWGRDTRMDGACQVASLAKTMGTPGSVRDPALKVEGDRDGKLTFYFGFHVYALMHTYICTHKNILKCNGKWEKNHKCKSIHLYASVMGNSYAFDILAYLITINSFL